VRKIFKGFQKKIAEQSGSQFALARVTNQMVKTVSLTDADLFF
jgi:hypothetical protein